MGRMLQIRVMATTYSEDDVRRAWPKLFELAFPPGSPLPATKIRGVLELVRSLGDLHLFSDDLPTEARLAMDEHFPKIAVLRDGLEKNLADWKAGEANAYSDRLEDAIDLLEADMPRN
ncbi:MAG: hypothetical protein EOM25_09770 [Deltaproteobacteria bacterium]|nr:hypothetical protein [Deltaproteobacteria bacterium]